MVTNVKILWKNQVSSIMRRFGCSYPSCGEMIKIILFNSKLLYIHSHSLVTSDGWLAPTSLFLLLQFQELSKKISSTCSRTKAWNVFLFFTGAANWKRNNYFHFFFHQCICKNLCTEGSSTLFDIKNTQNIKALHNFFFGSFSLEWHLTEIQIK